MKRFPIPPVPYRESASEQAPRPYHVSERAQPSRRIQCQQNCNHPACAQGCKVEDRRRAFMEGQ